ncbi:MAG: hypothetical protein ABEJ06_02585 [Haloarculaceae archaeon]
MPTNVPLWSGLLVLAAGLYGVSYPHKVARVARSDTSVEGETTTGRVAVSDRRVRFVRLASVVVSLLGVGVVGVVGLA